MKKINTLELHCIDYILCNIEKIKDMDEWLKSSNYSISLKHKILKRLLNIHDPPFSFPTHIPPNPSARLIEKVFCYESTSELDLSNVPFWMIKNVDQFRFLSNARNIRSFSLSKFPSLTSDLVYQYLELIGEQLLVLDLSRCPLLNDSVIHYVSHLCPNLQHLILEDCSGIFGSIFQRSITINNNDTLIKATNIASLTSAPHTWLMKKMSNLLELNISGCKSITPRNLFTLKTCFPCLRVFSFGKTFLSDEEGVNLVQALPATLVSLDLSFNPIGTNTLKALVPSTKNWTTFNLKSLSLGYCRVITALDLSYVIIGLSSSLEYLSIPGCFQLDKGLFDNLMMLNRNDRMALKTLDISYCSQFTTHTFNHLQNLLACKDQFNILRYNSQGFTHHHIWS
ncbi:hypothetical protein CYY_006697 [Polysphondylium violaceum]|uniref:Uncharacterized protein n=1 Tax=Polysphondylium violaceum TaxID=133409 RepID=A0A8J4V5J9_9MYCE|nr:hypothetical protein CYY_006697 [Polysphondylium violaceum]